MTFFACERFERSGYKHFLFGRMSLFVRVRLLHAKNKKDLRQWVDIASMDFSLPHKEEAVEGAVFHWWDCPHARRELSELVCLNRHALDNLECGHKTLEFDGRGKLLTPCRDPETQSYAAYASRT